MIDKAALLTLIIFVLTGIYSYDQYAKKHGGISPVRKIVDLAGLGRYNEPEVSSSTVTHQTIHYNLKDSLARLKEKYHEIENQKIKLIQEHKTILKKIIENNNQVEVYANELAKILNEERQEFIQRYPQLRHYSEEVRKIKEEPNPHLRRQKFEALEKQYIQALKSLSATLNLPAENISYEDTNGMASPQRQKMTVIIDQCADVEACLGEKIDEMNGTLTREADRLIIRPHEEVHKVMGSAQKLRSDYLTTIENYETEEHRLTKKDQEVRNKLNTMVEQLTQITDMDLKDLMSLYLEFEEEQKIFLEQLKLNQEIVKERQAQFREQSSRMLENISQISHLKVIPLALALEDVTRQQDYWANEVSISEARLREALNQHTLRQQEYFRNIEETLAQYHDYATQIQRNRESERENHSKREAIDRHLQEMRYKARDLGF